MVCPWSCHPSCGTAHLHMAGAEQELSCPKSFPCQLSFTSVGPIQELPRAFLLSQGFVSACISFILSLEPLCLSSSHPTCQEETHRSDTVGPHLSQPAMLALKLFCLHVCSILLQPSAHAAFLTPVPLFAQHFASGAPSAVLSSALLL